MGVSYRGERMNGNMPFSLFNGMEDRKKRRGRFVAEENYIKKPETPKKGNTINQYYECMCFCLRIERDRKREELISREVRYLYSNREKKRQHEIFMTSSSLPISYFSPT